MYDTKSLWTATVRKKERWTSTLQSAPYKDYKLLVLMSFEVTSVTATSVPACCDDAPTALQSMKQPHNWTMQRQI